MLRRVEPRRRASGGGRGVYGAILTASFLLLSAPAFANVGAAPVDFPSYNQALQSYNLGDYARALGSAKPAARAGDFDAAMLAGYILREGLAGAPDFDEAVTFYLMAAQGGNSDAMVALGEMGHYGQGGLTAHDAKIWLTKAAQFGRKDAMRALAEMNIKGAGITPNASEGKTWLKLAAEQGDAQSAKRMGDLNIETAPNRALKYYKQGAAAGDIEAAYAAAIMYAENLSIKPNEFEAARLMEQAARGGHPAAMADFGLLVYQGLAGDKSASSAANWFKKAAMAGDDQGKFFYAFTLAKGDGVSQNYEEAYFWILQTDKSGIPDYDKDIDTLRTRLEANVSADILAKARSRAQK
ncbi:MAG: tetratricopeptide repeat protein [Robiginitomaculum sp.]